MSEEEITPVKLDTSFRPNAAPEREPFDDLDRLATLMDSQFSIPGLKFRFGLDPLLGLVPGIGDTISLLISAYIIKRAHEQGLPHHVKARMIGNVAVDWLVGLIPFVGDIFDVGIKANRRNIDLIRRHRNKTRV